MKILGKKSVLKSDEIYNKWKNVHVKTAFQGNESHLKNLLVFSLDNL